MESVRSGELIRPFQSYLVRNAIFDVDHHLARATRRRFLENRAMNGQLVLAAHFPPPSMGHVEKQDDAFRFRYLEG